MNQQISQEYFIHKFASISLSETDDDYSKQSSPALDSRLLEFVSALPQHIKQKLENFKPHSDYQVSKQSDESVYFGTLESGIKHGNGIQVWPQVGNLLFGTWQNDLLQGFCTMHYRNGDIFEAQFQNGRTNGFGIFISEKQLKEFGSIISWKERHRKLRMMEQDFMDNFITARKMAEGFKCSQMDASMKDLSKITNFKAMEHFIGVMEVIIKDNFKRVQLWDLEIMQTIMDFYQLDSSLKSKTQSKEVGLNKNLQSIMYINQYNQSLLIEKIHLL